MNIRIFLFALALSLSSSARADLVAYWPFIDTGTLGNDVVGGTVLTATGATFTASGKFGGGVALSGSTQYLAGTVNNLPIGNSSYTQSAWFKPTVLGARGIVGWGAYGGTRRVIALRFSDSGNGFSHYWWGQDLVVTGLATNFLDGNWHHVATTYNGTTRRIYLNGAQVAADVPGTNNATALNFRIGSTNNSEYFSGTLDDVALYDNALTAAEVQFLAAGGSPIAGPIITSFTATPATAFEGGAVALSWVVNTANVMGTFSYEIKYGAAVVSSGSAATGTFNAVVPDLAGIPGPVTWTFRAIETGATNVTKTASASITGDPGIPTASSQAGLTTPGGTPLAITLAGSDPNSGTLSYIVVTPPTRGTVSAGTAAARTYTPTNGLYGADEFTFKVSDGKYESAPATVRLTVLTPPFPPTSVSVDDLTIGPENVAGDFLSTVSSPDPNTGEAHTFTLVAGAGSEENFRFTIVGNQLRAAVSFAALTGVPQRIRIRSTDAGGLFVEGAFVLSVAPKTRGVVINEIHYNGVNNTVRNSFIEIYNDGPTTANLAGWRISGGVDYLIPTGTTLAAGAYLIIAENPATILSVWGKTAIGPWDNAVITYPDGAKESTGLSNDGATVRLRDATNSIVSDVDYENHSPWPADGNGEGSSIELINPLLDGTHGSNWASAKAAGTLAGVSDIASPGAVNIRFAATAAPAIRNVTHTPLAPTSSDRIIVTARITDPNGVASASLAYQLCAAGNYIPSTLPKTVSGGNFVNVATPLAANPAFELAANWTTVAMNDDGIGDDVLGGDGIWTSSIPPQANRTLVRYRITTADNLGASARVPYIGDPSRNFACFVYNGVPAYEGTSAANLQTMPVYHFLTRKADFDQCVAYDANISQRLVAGTSWNFENWEACFVCNGVVYDHIPYRLKGANGRYTASGTGGVGNGKRAFKFYFNKGYEFDAIDQTGNPYPEKWSTMITENTWENRATHTFSLNEMVNMHLFNQLGVPAPRGHWSHFRTLMQTAEQPDKWHGDFWGLMWVHEDYDRRFLKAHDLKNGNLYKLTRDGASGIVQLRYQSTFGPTNGSDHDDIHNSLIGTSTPAYITSRVNLDLWSRYHAFCEAIRHYDYWPDGDNNGGWYFYPNYNAANGSKGVLWYLPSDVDATWGPTWNSGHDVVHNALFNDSASSGGDTGTNPTLWPNYFNQVREIRTLLWQSGQLNPLIDEFAAVIRPIVNAEFTRWHPTNGAPADSGNFGGLFGPNNSALNAVGQTALDLYIAGMKDFAFDADNNGGTWPGGNIGVGGRAAFLDTLGNNLAENSTKYPATPTITFSGSVGFPVNDLRFTTSAFSDPQGAGTYAGIQWRIAEVNTSAVWTAGVKRLLEINASHDSGALAIFAGEYKFPATACAPGKRYRARVRMKDNTGRWSTWSAAAEFTAGTFDSTAYASQLVISEIMYHATDPTNAERAVAAALVPPQAWDDDSFDYIELRNVSASAVDLTGFQFTSGFDFTFPNGTIIAPGANLLVVQNIDAFNTRYGTGKPIAGVWSAGKLSNGGEAITLQYGLVTPAVFSFTYADNPALNWPTAPDGLGASLVRIAPEDTTRNASLGVNWRSSITIGGSPGGDDRQTFSTWLTNNSLAGALTDTDGDGLANLLEYAFGGNPTTDSQALLPTAARQTIAANNYLTLTFQRANIADDLTQTVEFSTDLVTWPIAAVQVSSADNGNCTRTEVWRSSVTVDSTLKLFGRVRFTRPDGLGNLLEYAFGGSPSTDWHARLPAAARQTIAANNYLTLTFRRANISADLTQTVEFSTDLVTWPITAAQVSSADNGDGTHTEVWRSSVTVDSAVELFGRVRFTRP